MISLLKDWKGSVIVNGTEFKSINDVTTNFNELDGNISIILKPVSSKANLAANTNVQPETTNSGNFKIKVRSYMTKHSSPEFDFMAKWNNDVPMPMRIMVGTKEKETRGMVYMKLHADITQEKTFVCMKCGKQLTNPVSQYFGIGPECGGHNYVNPFDSDEELRNEVAKYREELRNITWEGWIIKSAIEEEEEL